MPSTRPASNSGRDLHRGTPLMYRRWVRTLRLPARCLRLAAPVRAEVYLRSIVVMATRVLPESTGPPDIDARAFRMPRSLSRPHGLVVGLNSSAYSGVAAQRRRNLTARVKAKSVFFMSSLALAPAPRIISRSSTKGPHMCSYSASSSSQVAPGASSGSCLKLRPPSRTASLETAVACPRRLTGMR